VPLSLSELLLLLLLLELLEKSSLSLSLPLSLPLSLEESELELLDEDDDEDPSPLPSVPSSQNRTPSGLSRYSSLTIAPFSNSIRLACGNGVLASMAAKRAFNVARLSRYGPFSFGSVGSFSMAMESHRLGI
jgi:hypothetical protein